MDQNVRNVFRNDSGKVERRSGFRISIPVSARVGNNRARSASEYLIRVLLREPIASDFHRIEPKSSP